MTRQASPFIATVIGALVLLGCQRENQLVDRGDVTFNTVAPIVWEKCACCHRDGEAAPFSLVEFGDVQDRKKQIREVISSGFMPPWLPDSLDVAYENDARLAPQQKQLVLSWLDGGSPEGASERLPAKPAWTKGWQLGKPDLIVSMPQPFVLPADGRDIYRNFVVPIPMDQIRYVRALEFRPTNYRVVHHAFMLVDPTRKLRRLTEKDGQPGFGGMDTKSAVSPNGHFVGWQPGRRAHEIPSDMAWRLLPGTDLVLQVHMQCTGKPEQFAASVGIFFTNQKPTRFPHKLVLRSTEIDIPPGVTDYEIQDSMQLPVDVDVMAIAPHAHYLGKEMHAIAELPDGTSKSLLRIKDWDLNWQSEYRFNPWVRLPAGTVLKQRFVYDNSTNNIRNPHSPPRRVTYGLEATDEMGSLWFQIIPVVDSQQSKLTEAIGRKTLKDLAGLKRKTLAEDPHDVDANIQMGKIALTTQRFPLAFKYFERAAMADKRSAEARYFLGHALLRNEQWEFGIEQLQQCLRLDPTHLSAHYDLGMAAAKRGNQVQAESHFRKAISIHQYDAGSLKQLGRSLLSQGKTKEALENLRKSLNLNPTDASLRKLLDQLEGVQATP